MGVFYTKPEAVVPKWGHSILIGQSCWFVANDVSRVPRDVLQNPPPSPGSLSSAITYGSSAFGKSYIGAGSILSQIDLGSTNRFLNTPLTQLGPTATGNGGFSVAWCEQHSGVAGTFEGLMCLFPFGGTPATQSWGILRSSSSILDPANYGRVAAGPYQAGNRLAGFLLPPKLSDNKAMFFVLTSTAGPYLGNGFYGAYNLYWSGTEEGTEKGQTGGNSAATGATQNYFGWDNWVSHYSGALDNMRVWNRTLFDHEIKGLLADPYLGCVRPKLQFPGFVPPPASASNYFLVCQ